MRGWLESETVRHLGAALLYWLLAWTSLGLVTDVWDWRSLAGGALSIVIPVVQRIAKPDLIAPVAWLNRRNPTP